MNGYAHIVIVPQEDTLATLGQVEVIGFQRYFNIWDDDDLQNHLYIYIYPQNFDHSFPFFVYLPLQNNM